MKKYQEEFLKKAKRLTGQKKTASIVILGRKPRKKNFFIVVNGNEYRVDVLRCRDTRDVERLSSKISR